MPFPFIAPLKDWIKLKLEKKEANPQSSILSSPFAMLTSGAVVLKGGSVKQLLSSQDYGKDAYYGCVLTNTTDTSKLYQTGRTIVGYDLNGKEIVVEGEKNRRVSPPIIESIEIDTSGGNNTLKVAQIKIKVFTLKQLEMFELFFLRPSMNVVLEYGWNTDIRAGGAFSGLQKNFTIEKHLFAKKNWETYKKDYVNFFTDKSTINDYTRILKETDGNYDFMIGRVTNFTYSPNVDGTYDIDLQVSAGNELQLWPAYRAARSSSNTDKKNNKIVNNYESFIAKMNADLKMNNLQTIFPKKTWKDEFFNYGITNEKQKDTIVSKTPYISFKAVLEIINNLKIVQNDHEGIKYDTYKFDNKDLIPVTSNPYIMSTNSYILIPGKLPNIKVVTIETENKIVVSTDDKERQDCLINGKSFNLNNTKIYDFESNKALDVPEIEIESKVTGKKLKIFANTGNLLNIFISYERFLEIVDSADSLTQILTPILTAINDTMLGLCDLQIQKINDSPSVGKLEIVDRKTQHNITNEMKSAASSTSAPTYKFKIGTTGISEDGKPHASIVKNLSFNMEMSTLMQAQALYSIQLAIAKQNKKTNTDASKEIDNFVSADLSYAPNSDGYFAINDMEISIIKKMPVPKTERTAEEQKAEKEQLEEVKTSKYTKFLMPGGKIKNLVYQDSGLIQLYLVPKTNKNSLALSYLNITLGIDGIAGFSCGEYFNIEGIPEIYNQRGYFQILNVKQGIDETGWKTTIEAGFLIKTE
jgi:hypothetical protein